MKKELSRQTIHIFLFVLVFLLNIISRWQMVAILASLLLVALILIPHSGLRHYLYRRQDKIYSIGAICYFGTLMILTLIFPLYAVAAGWSALALGDGMATIIGKKIGRVHLPWNQKKTLEGSLAFVAATLFGSLVTISWLEPSFSFWQVIIMALAAGVAGALIESLDIEVNDNITATLAAAFVVALI